MGCACVLVLNCCNNHGIFVQVKHVLGSEELFFPITRRCTCRFKQICCNCHLISSEELLEKVDNVKKLPKGIKVLCSAVIRLVSKVLHYFLLWGTEDSDLTIEEEVRECVSHCGSYFDNNYTHYTMLMVIGNQHIRDLLVLTSPFGVNHFIVLYIESLIAHQVCTSKVLVDTV